MRAITMNRGTTVAAAMTVAILLLASACAGGTDGTPTPTPPPSTSRLPSAEPATTPAVQSGSWSGTVTVEYHQDNPKSETRDNGESGKGRDVTVYTEINEMLITDTYSASGPDDPDHPYYAKVEAPISVQGSQDLETKSVRDAYNGLSCHLVRTKEYQNKGGWSFDTQGTVSVEFRKDGSYQITVEVTGAKPEQPLPVIQSDSIQILDNDGSPLNCPEVPATFPPDQLGPNPLYASQDNYNFESVMHGTVNKANPGNSVDGSGQTEKSTSGGDWWLTTWHLVHSGGPIVLPHA